MTNQQILDQVNQYYTDKVNQHGATHQGVDWNSQESQHLRFRQLMRLHDAETPFSILDYGCGYGEMVDYLQQQKLSFVYQGYDIAPAMITTAQNLHPDFGTFTSTPEVLQPADYVVASGIFNVRQVIPDADWWQYILDTLGQMWQLTHKGMAFNCLTSYSDKPYMRDYLYYADPTVVFDYCKRTFSKQVALLHDYGLYEFTILVRKETA